MTSIKTVLQCALFILKDGLYKARVTKTHALTDCNTFHNIQPKLIACQTYSFILQFVLIIMITTPVIYSTIINSNGKCQSPIIILFVFS